MSGVYSPSFHTELLTERRATFCAEMPVSNDTWDFYVVALQRMPKELEHEGENGHFSLIICL